MKNIGSFFHRKFLISWIVVIFGLIQNLPILSQSLDYLDNVEYIYTTAKDGLRIRESASTEAKSIGTIPFGKRVLLKKGELSKQEDGKLETIGKVTGKWVPIEYQVDSLLKGWIFSGFTSPVPTDFESGGVIILNTDHPDYADISYHLPIDPDSIYNYNQNAILIKFLPGITPINAKKKYTGAFYARCGLGSGYTKFEGEYIRKGKNEFILSGTGSEHWQSNGLETNEIKLKNAVLKIESGENFILKATIKGLGQCFEGTTKLLWSEYIQLGN